MNRLLIVTASCIAISINSVLAFTTSSIDITRRTATYDVSKTLVVLDAKKRKRKRKVAPITTSEETPSPPPPPTPPLTTAEKETTSVNIESPAVPEKRKTGRPPKTKSYIPISDEATLKFLDEEISSDDMMQIPEAFDDGGIRDNPNADMFDLPDIKQVLQEKKKREAQEEMEAQVARERVKIKRSDKEAFARLLEQEPYADANDAFFEKEEYNTVSALLGEESIPFVGIPTGPLQVGHTTLALGIILMAFVEYPGFPLTNLPTPLRACLQQGLLAVYLINAVLAILSIFKAQSRGQPVGLWVAKTLTVGGLAFDQLTQLPTLEEIKAAEEEKKNREARFGRGRKAT